jgi:uncharacterized membrane protein YkoI
MIVTGRLGRAGWPRAARTSLKQALATAEKQANGKAIDAEVEREGSGVQYRVTVASGDRTQDVRIDGNGQVVSR